MYRKLVSFLISLSCLMTLLSPTMLFMPTSSLAAGTGVLQFQDNFSGGMSLWTGVTGSWLVNNGALTNTSTALSTIGMRGTHSVWQDQTVDVVFQRGYATSGDYTGILTRYISDTSNLMLMVRSTGLSYKIGGAAEVALYTYPFALNTSYEVEVSLSGSSATVYFKAASDTTFTTAGTISGLPVQSGKVMLRTSGVEAQFSSVNVWNPQVTNFMANGSILSAVYTGSSAILPLTNTTGETAIWSTSDPTIAAVDQNGVVTGIKRGLVTLTAATVDKSVYANFDVYVHDQVNTNGVLQFQDNFSNDMYIWNVASGAWGVTNSGSVYELAATSTTVSEIAPSGPNTAWRNQTVSLRENMGQSTSGFVGVSLRYVSSADYTMLLVRGTGLSYVKAGGTEVSLYTYTFTPSVDYDIKLITNDDSEQVYFKAATDTNYTFAGSISNISYEYGNIRPKTYNVTANFTNVNVWNNETTPFMLNNKITVINAGSGQTLALTNTTGKGVTWSSSNSSVATVDTTGKVTAVAPGTAEITAVTADNSYQDTSHVIVNATIDTTGYLQFTDNFNNWMHMWSLPSGVSGTLTNSFDVQNGRLINKAENTFSVIGLKGTSSVWDNQTVSFRFRMDQLASGGYLALVLRNASASDYTMVMIRSTGIHYIKGSGSETSLFTYPFNVGTSTDYDLQVIAVGGSAKIYVKQATDSTYTFAGSIPNISLSKGNIQFRTYYVLAEFTNVSVVNNNLSPFHLNKRIAVDPIGTGEALQLSNTTGTAVTWTSSNTNVATVDQLGNVTAVSQGMATITVATTDNSYQDNCDVIVTQLPTGVTLNSTAETLQVGENENLSAIVSPSNADNPSTIWTSSNPAIVSIFGTASKARGIEALSTGTATITVTTAEGGYSASCVVTVVAPPTVTSETATFQVDGSSSVVPQYFLGVHNPQVSEIGHTTDFNPLSYQNLAADLKLKNVRGPDGTWADFYLYQEGTVMNSKDPRYALYYGQMTNGAIEKTNLTTGYPALYLADSYNLANALGVPYIYDLNVISQSVDEILAQIQALKQQTTHLYL